jgi:protein-tyrosine-phosphatase
MNLLFVCAGNTCRSPMAEGILKRMLRNKGIDNVTVRSAGVSAVNGSPVSDMAYQVAKRHGIDLNDHRSQPVADDLVEWADWVIAMTPRHRGLLKEQYPKKEHAIILLKELGRPDPRPEDLEILDPFGSDYWEYERSFLELEAEIERIFPYLDG